MPLSTRWRLFVALVPVALAGLVLLWLRSSPEADIRVSGTVVPAAELDITSPIGARVTEVHVRVGESLAIGSPIVSLDLGTAEQHADRIERDLAITNSQQLQAQMALQNSATAIDAEIDRKTIELRSLNTTLANHRRLLAEGQGTDEQVQASLLNVQQAEFDLARLQEERWRLTQSEAAEVDAVTSERRTLVLEALETRQLLERGTVRSDRPSLVVSVAARPGVVLQAGEAVARVADLTAFHVVVTHSDQTAGIRPGMPALVVVGDVEVGAIVAPSSAGGASGGSHLVLTLADPSDPQLQNGMEVQVRFPMNLPAR